MPIIRFTEADRLSSTLVPTGWYTATITEIDGPKASKSEKSVNFFTKFQLTANGSSKSYAGKELQIVFNTKSSAPSLLGTQQYMPHSHYFAVASAIFNKSREELPLDLDTDTLVGKPLDIKIEKGIHEGVPMNWILAFVPAGTGKDASVPF